MKKLLVIGDRSDIAQAAIAILKSRYKVVGVNRSLCWYFPRQQSKVRL